MKPWAPRKVSSIPDMSKKTGTYRARKGPARPFFSSDPLFAEIRLLQRAMGRGRQLEEDLIAEALEPRVEKVVQGERLE